MGSRKIFLIAGEASGDNLGGALVRELRSRDPDLDFVGLGGERMEAEGCRILYPLPGISVMWFSQVFRQIRKFIGIFHRTLRWIQVEKPDAVLLIDYPGFNLRIARRLKGKGIPVIDYVSPQVWAWNPGRVPKIAETVDLMMVLFPFEEKIYQDAGMRVRYVGHPMFDALAEEPAVEPSDHPVVGILPGSRLQEIRHGLPIMIRAAHRVADELDGVEFRVSCARESFREVIDDLLRQGGLDATIIEGSARGILQASGFCFVTSGSGTLECMYFETPMVILYRVSLPAYMLGWALRTSRFIGMPNVLADEEIVPEFLVWKDASDAIAEAALKLIRPGPDRDRCIDALRDLKGKVVEPGAAGRAAEAVLEFLGEKA